MKIWLILVDHESEAIGNRFSVWTSDEEDINTLMKKVKEKRSNDLANVDATSLIVWKMRSTSNANGMATFEVLNPEDRVMDLELSDRQTLIVKLPAYAARELKEFQRYSEIVVTPGLSPSEGAKLIGYREIQVDEAQVIYDGRMTLDSPLYTAAPPIRIFHPIFDEFFRLANDEDVQPTTDDLKRVYKFMSIVSDIHGPEIDYSDRLLSQLCPILNAEVHEEQNPDGTRLDGVIALRIGDSRIPYFFLELKREIGEGSCDPTTQVSLCMRRSWIDKSREDIRQRCCCPTLLVAVGGPWLSVLGAVFTDKFIVQRLTDMRWMALSSTQEDTRVYHNARIFVALRTCLSKLKTFYETLNGASPFVANQPHPRYFPYLSSFTAEDGSVTQFQYLTSLETRGANVTYLAKTLPDECKVVVKFVSRYSKEVHEFLAREGYAPSLRYYGPLPETGLSSIFLGPAPPSLCLPSDLMHMVVMDYIDARPDPPRVQVETILTRLHSAGYVFGDMRKQNILFDAADRKVKLIDFDWCGRYDMNDADEGLPDHVRKLIEQNKKHVQIGDGSYDYAHYPLSMSTIEGMWAPGMEPLAPIRPIHDWMMFQRLEW